MARDLVVGLDSSTQSTKAIAWSRRGEAVAEGRAPIPADTPAPGRVEQDVEAWWGAAVSALQQVTKAVDPARIAGLAISNQRETVAFLDAAGRATHPAIVWLDERAESMLAQVSTDLGADNLHRVTGKPPDLTPVIYRLAWMRRHMPGVLDQTVRIVDVHGYLTGRLTGRQVASWTSADPSGVFDIVAKDWSGEILDYLGLTAAHFAMLERPGAAIGAVTASAAAETGLAEGTPVIAAGGDGQCAGLGVNAARPGAIYLNLGTAIITGAWSADPAVSQNWRTMTSPTGEGYFLEGCQRAGAFFLNWFVDTFAGGTDTPDVFDRLEQAAAALPIGSGGVTVSPYLTGCMDPHWDPGARGTFAGLSASHGLGHLYRASLEALTLESARCIAAMRDEGLPADEILAVGGGAQSPLWCQMIADATGLPVVQSRSLEASSLGAGMSAAAALGWFPDMTAAAEGMSQRGDTCHPNPSNAAEWQALSLRQADAYRAPA